MKSMAFILLVATTIILYACPYSSTHTLDDIPSIYAEDALTGNWAAFVKKPVSGKEEPVKLILSKKTETEYNVVFTGNIKELKPFRIIEKDSVAGTAFMSTAAGRQFLNIRVKDNVYIAEIIYKNDMLSLLPLSEHFTSKLIMTNAELRTCVELHYKTRVHALYDDDFCLKNMVRVN